MEVEPEKPHDTNTESNRDNGIFEFMTPDRAIELYKRIHSSGIPDLDWKFYGRRKANEQEDEENRETGADKEDPLMESEKLNNEPANTEFDFDEEFGDPGTYSSVAGESLRLKQRQEPGSEKKTNLSDIMSDIMKESHAESE